MKAQANKTTVTFLFILMCSLVEVGCARFGPVNLTERKEVNFSEIARFRVCNLGAAIDSIDGKKLLLLSTNLINEVAYVEPGEHKVVVSGAFGAQRGNATINVSAVAGKVYTFHYRMEGNEILAFYKERPKDYPTSCDGQKYSADD